jgi:3-oxoacyl-[acyl-carrier protein] reductase
VRSSNDQPPAAWPGRFAGKNVIVTGGASGIGLATASRFLREGAQVVVYDVNGAGIDAAAGTLEAAAAEGDGSYFAVQGDVTSPEAVDGLISQAVERLGPIDVVVSNAGIAYDEPFLDTTLQQWHRTIDVNLTSMFIVSQAAARHMKERGSGVILLTSSTNGLVGEDRYSAYNASKGGVTLLTKSLAIELGRHGIRANAVCPGYIVTPLAELNDSPEFMANYAATLPIGHLGNAHDVAAAFAFLASDDASFITGETLVIDGGQLTY